MNNSKLSAIDLFSGAGGLHIGFENAGFDIRLCIDNDALVERTHKRNFPNIPMINHDIRDITTEQIRVCFQKHKSKRKLKEYAVRQRKPKGKQGVNVE